MGLPKLEPSGGTLHVEWHPTGEPSRLLAHRNAGHPDSSLDFPRCRHDSFCKLFGTNHCVARPCIRAAPAKLRRWSRVCSRIWRFVGDWRRPSPVKTTFRSWNTSCDSRTTCPAGPCWTPSARGGRTCESRRAAIARGPEEKEIACNAEAIRLRTSACSSLRRVGTGACRPLFQSDELIEFTL